MGDSRRPLGARTRHASPQVQERLRWLREFERTGLGTTDAKRVDDLAGMAYELEKTAGAVASLAQSAQLLARTPRDRLRLLNGR